MAYKNKNGESQHTAKEKIQYHTYCANIGIDSNGTKLTLSERIRHGVLAENQKRKLNRFMSKTKSMRDAIVQERKSKSK